MASIDEIIEGQVEMELENYVEKKNNQKTPADEQINPRDRLSYLPEFIIHHIFSFLDVKQSCVTACLSRRFYRLWSTMPVLDFDVVRSPEIDFLCFIHRTMRRYEFNNTVIKTFRLKINVDEYHTFFVDIGSFINQWVQIAVYNHVEILDICILPYDGYGGENYPCKKYKLHEIVLSANKLKVLSLYNLDFIDFEDDNDNDERSINLRSLECLHLDNVSIKDDSLLRRMISSCPLKVVTIKSCPAYIQELNFSKYSNIRTVVIRQEDEPFYGHVNLINLEACSLEDFSYYGHCWNEEWSLKIEDPGKWLNLRKLTLGSASITDEMVESLVPRLPSLQRLKFYKCLSLKRAKISSSSLERFKLSFCSKLEKLEIDAPNLDSFSFSSYLHDKYPVLSLCKSPRQCKAMIFQGYYCYPIKTCYFTRLWEFLELWNIFNVVGLSLDFEDKVEYNVEDAMKIQFGPPYKLSELELTVRNTSPVESAISAVLEGLFFTVRPSILSLNLRMPQQPTYVFTQPDVYKIIVQKLSSCRISWRHALNGIEVESVDWDHLYEESKLTSFMKFGFNLCW